MVEICRDCRMLLEAFARFTLDKLEIYTPELSELHISPLTISFWPIKMASSAVAEAAEFLVETLTVSQIPWLFFYTHSIIVYH